MQRATSCDPKGQFMIRRLKRAVQTLVSGTLAYMPMRPKACLVFCMVSGVLTLCRGQRPGLAVAEGELRLGEIGDSLGSAQLCLAE